MVVPAPLITRRYQCSPYLTARAAYWGPGLESGLTMVPGFQAGRLDTLTMSCSIVARFHIATISSVAVDR